MGEEPPPDRSASHRATTIIGSAGAVQKTGRLVLASAVVYLGLAIALIGLIAVARPLRRLRIPSRVQGAAVVAAGLVVSAMGLMLPPRESRVSRVETRLDEFMPVWQFKEFHRREVDAPPVRAFEAMKAVTAEEIFLFRALTSIRRGGRPVPTSILNPAQHEPLIDVATRSGFVLLAEDSPRELVIGTVVKAPAGTRGKLTADFFRRAPPPGFALATMNFLVTPIGTDRSIVSTETRVFASGPSARRAFGMYWRLIYPGSALIRRMWLRAIGKRAKFRADSRIVAGT